MLVNQNHTQNFGAVSAIDVKDRTGKPIMVMNASINQNGTVTFNQQIQNPDLYKDNQSEVDADFETFKEQVIASIK